MKETRSTPSCSASACPATGPRPVTRLKTPAGRPASCDGLGEELGGQRGVLGGLEDDRAARGEGRGDLGDDLVQRVVPGRDRADDADRLAAGRWSCRPSPRRRTRRPVRRTSRRPATGTPAWTVCENGERRAELGGDGLGDLVLAGGEHVAQGARCRAARSAGGVAAQPGKAARAARTAASTSSAVPAGTWPMTCSSAGFTTSIVSGPGGGPPLRRRCTSRRVPSSHSSRALRVVVRTPN